MTLPLKFVVLLIFVAVGKFQMMLSGLFVSPPLIFILPVLLVTFTTTVSESLVKSEKSIEPGNCSEPFKSKL